MNRWSVVFAVLLVAFMSLPVLAGPELKPYDDFNGGFINPTKWRGYENANKIAREGVRELNNQSLRMLTKAWGDTTNNSGSLSDAQKLQIVDPIASDTKSLQADVVVKRYQLRGAVSNPALSDVRARVYGEFFNDGSGGSNDLTGEVYAHITVGRWTDSQLAPRLLQVKATVARCDDPSCANQTLAGGAAKDMGTLTLNQKATLSVEWDKDANKFVFKFSKIGKKTLAWIPMERHRLTIPSTTLCNY